MLMEIAWIIVSEVCSVAIIRGRWPTSAISSNVICPLQYSSESFMDKLIVKDTLFSLVLRLLVAYE